MHKACPIHIFRLAVCHCVLIKPRHRTIEICFLIFKRNSMGLPKKNFNEILSLDEYVHK